MKRIMSWVRKGGMLGIFLGMFFLIGVERAKAWAIIEEPWGSTASSTFHNPSWTLRTDVIEGEEIFLSLYETEYTTGNYIDFYWDQGIIDYCHGLDAGAVPYLSHGNASTDFVGSDFQFSIASGSIWSDWENEDQQKVINIYNPYPNSNAWVQLNLAGACATQNGGGITAIGGSSWDTYVFKPNEEEEDPLSWASNSSSWMNAGGVPDFAISITANSSTDFEAWNAESTYGTFLEDWLGSATATIPGCYIYASGQFVDLVQGLTTGNLTPAVLTITASSSTFPIDLTNFGSEETTNSIFPHWVFVLKEWIWELSLMILIVGFAWHVYEDITGVKTQSNDDMP